jgi:mRNA-degrading endonuclease HigB of HigAB toxin-antitoxin module
LRDPQAERDRALTRRQRLPTRETLHAWDDELFRALDGAADEKTSSLLLATMLDGFPRGMVPNVQTYVEAALLVIGDQALSPDIFAAAIIRIWRKDRFPPTLAELLDECDRARQSAANARRVVAKMIALLDNAEEVLDATGDPGEHRKRDGSWGVRKARWASAADMKRLYRTASIITAERAVFNIKDNDYRLVAAIDYEKNIVWIKWMGAHAEYDRIDAKEVHHDGRG